MTNARKKEREEAKKKMQWYCHQLRIKEPAVWSYENVKKLAKKINERNYTIIVCRDCGKIDVSYPHINCDIEYENYRNESHEYYD